MSGLGTRVVSAIAALALLVGTYLWLRDIGIIALSVIVAIISVNEFNRLVFKPLKASIPLRVWFFTCCSLLLILTIWLTDGGIIVAWALLTTAFYASSLWMVHDKLDKQRLVAIFSASALGFIYCALLPSVTIRVMLLEKGMAWFIVLLALVFAGDIFAYFGGQWFGNKKLMPAISPKKTVAGSVSGAFGSALLSSVCGFYLFPEMSLWVFAVIGLVAAYFAQSGDLFISLLKRSADVKDSGRLMPGHGGALDRLDGVFFAAPVVYAAAYWLLNAS